MDYIGISFLVMGVGSLQILLDKGQEDDWFGSHFITTLIATATICLISLLIWEWYRKEPIIDVRMFKSFNFAAANLMMFMMGFMLFSTLVLGYFRDYPSATRRVATAYHGPWCSLSESP